MLPHMTDTLRALLYLLSAVFMFETVGLFAKLVSPDIPLYTIVFARSFFAIFPLLVGVMLSGGIKTLRTQQPKLHLLRGVVGFLTLLVNFYAVRALDLASVTAIQFTMPFFMILLATLWLGEKLTPERLAAVIIGFGGALLIIGPTAQIGLGLAGLAALASALLGGFSGVIIRKLTRTDNSLTIALSFSTFGSIFAAGLLLKTGFVMPATHDLLLLAAAGTAGGCAQLLLTQAYRFGQVSLIAPFEYTALLWASLFGYVFWDKIPTLLTLAGAVIIVAADLWVILRDKKRKAEPQAA